MRVCMHTCTYNYYNTFIHVPLCLLIKNVVLVYICVCVCVASLLYYIVHGIAPECLYMYVYRPHNILV